jgi:K+-transporting ATPase ATPase C chain
MFSELSRQLRPALIVFLALTLLTGVVYPLVVTAIAWTLFPTAAGGSLIVQEGVVRGSRLVGQPFDDLRYFWGRPSATGPFAYNASVSSGSNLGPTNPALIDAVQQRAADLRSAHPGRGTIPVDLVTASASGLDPHISPAAAQYQIERVAAARQLPAEQVRRLVEEQTEPETFGLLGEPRVNVLLLNMKLDELSAGTAVGQAAGEPANP